MNKRNSHLLILASIVTMGLTSCGGGSGSSSSQSNSDSSNSQSSSNAGSSNQSQSSSSQGGSNISVDPNIKDTISILVPSGNDNEKTMIKNAFDTGFSLLYPNVELDMQFVSISSYETNIRNRVIAGSLPDIVWTNSPEYIFLVKNDIAEPLNGYIQGSEDAGDFVFKDDFKTSYFNMASIDGLRYAVPRSADCVVTFYNKELLAQANIDTAKIKNGWTWSDFLDICAEWRAYQDGLGKADTYCVDAYLTGWGSVSYPLLRSFGADVLDNDGKISLDSDGTRNAVNCIRNLTEKKYSVKSGSTSGTSFDTGTTPFCFQSAAFSLYDEKTILHDKIDVVSFPRIMDNNTPKIGGGIAGYSINKKSHNKALAWQFLNYLISKEGQEKMAEGGLNLAPIRKDMDDFTTQKWGEGYTDKNLSAYLCYDDEKITEEYLSRVSPEYLSGLQEAFQDFVSDATNSRKSVDKVISDAVDAITDVLNS